MMPVRPTTLCRTKNFEGLPGDELRCHSPISARLSLYRPCQTEMDTEPLGRIGVEEILAVLDSGEIIEE